MPRSCEVRAMRNAEAGALITASATLDPFSLANGSSWRTEGSRGYLN